MAQGASSTTRLMLSSLLLLLVFLLSSAVCATDDNAPIPKNPCEWCRTLEPHIREKLEESPFVSISALCDGFPDVARPTCAHFILRYGRAIARRIAGAETAPCETLKDLADVRALFGEAPLLCSVEAVANYENFVVEQQRELDEQIKQFSQVMDLFKKVWDLPSPQQPALPSESESESDASGDSTVTETDAPESEASLGQSGTSDSGRFSLGGFFDRLAQKWGNAFTENSAEHSSSVASLFQDSQGNVWKETQSVFTSGPQADGTQSVLSMVSYTFVSSGDASGAATAETAAAVSDEDTFSRKSSLEGDGQEWQKWKDYLQGKVSSANLHLAFVGLLLVFLIGISVYLFKDLPLLPAGNSNEYELSRDLLNYEEFEKRYYESAKAEVDLSGTESPAPRGGCPFGFKKAAPAPAPIAEVDLSSK